MTKKCSKSLNKIVFMLITALLFLTSSNIIVSAVSVDLFANTQVNNNSGTTAVSPYLNVTNKPVTFTINGQSTSLGLIKTGKKYALLSVPSPLSSKVTPNGTANVTTTVTIPVADLPISGLLTLLSTLVTALTPLAITPQLQATLASLNTAITNLKKEDFGAQNMNLPITQISPTLLGTDISQGLLPILTGVLSQRLKDLKAVVATLPAAVNLAATPVLTAIDSLVTSLGDQNSTVSQNLVSASLLGSTNVSMPTNVSSPMGLTQDLAATIRGGIVQIDDVVLQLLSNFGGSTNIYFSAGTLTLRNDLLPGNLNFGTHPLQTKNDELWTAYAGGNSTNPVTTGTIRVEDTRTIEKNWSLKIAQSENWTNSQQSLSNPRLDVSLGGFTTNFPNTNSISNQTIHLVPNQQVNLISVFSATNPGYVQIPLNQFQLFVPKNTPRQVGNYQTTIQWIVSNTP